MFTTALLDPFAEWTSPKRSSVYVISDSEMQYWKQKKLREEVFELKRLLQHHEDRIEGHTKRIAQIKDTLDTLQKDIKELEPGAN